MNRAEETKWEAEALRERLSRLTEASLRINESLDLGMVLQYVVDSARVLTGARYSAITTLDSSGQDQEFITSGMTPEERQWMLDAPEGPVLWEYVQSLSEPLRVSDFQSHIRAMGISGFDPPVAVTSMMATSLRTRGETVGIIYLTKGEGREEFTPEDEETLVMFASQAALVIANARRHRDEQRARADLETLVNTAPIGVVVFDARTGNVVSINREMRRIISELHGPEGSGEQIVGLLTLRRADGTEVSLQEFPLTELLSIGETVRAEEIVLRAPDGRSVTTLLNATPIRSKEGEVESFVITLQDMSPMEELERLRAEFLGMVSHELRTPLAAIKGSAITLTEAVSDLEPAEMLQFFRIITDQADHMRDLIADLLDVARIETGTLPVNPEPSEVRALVDEARSRFQSGGGRSNLQMDIPQHLPQVMVDRRRIVQVLGNLLTNAARHSHQSSPIGIEAVLEGVHVAVSVSDDGLGIPPERVPHLFRKFSHVGGDEKTEDTGLGLAICKGIVEAHGGRIWAESDGPGSGSRFTFTIPVVEGIGPGPARPSGRFRRGERKRPRILCVDDDPRTLRYVRDALATSGYTPIVTADPEELFRLIGEEEPRLILLDLVLPGSDGIELMKQIREIADVPVIFLSVYGQDDVVARAFDMGAADYMVKPFSTTELVARIRAALRRGTVPQPVEPSVPYVLGDLTIDYVEGRVTLAGRPVKLTDIEYRLLFELSVAAGRVVTNGQLLQRVWGLDKSGGSGPVRNIIKRLRRKLKDDATNPTYIFNDPRVGYRMPRGDE